MSPKSIKKPCCDNEGHQAHLCELESQQEWDIIKQVTGLPAFRCENCGNVANFARNLCMPTDL